MSLEEEFASLELPSNVVSNVLKSRNKETIEQVLNYLLFRGGKENGEHLLTRYSVDYELMTLAESEEVEDVIRLLSLKILINSSASESGAKRIVKEPKNVKCLLKLALNRQSKFGDEASKILSNLTRLSNIASEVATLLEGDYDLPQLTEAVTDKSFNSRGCRLEYLALVLGNLCQSSDFRKRILDPEFDYLSKVLPVINKGLCIVERRGVASAVYNCLFDPTTHETLLSPPYDILPSLLLPLAGPEEFEMDEYEKLPVELQYLPEDKTREEDCETRNILLRSLLHLCNRRKYRNAVRDSNTYLILREYHKWEKDRQNLLAVENVIDLLIRTEEEIGVDDVSSVEIPDDLIVKFDKMDKDFLED